jgi:hypothetical protein
LLPMKPRIHAPATWKRGHQSGKKDPEFARGGIPSE